MILVTKSSEYYEDNQIIKISTLTGLFKACKSDVQSRSASIAQWLEHWSRKPGVVSSILTGGYCFCDEIEMNLVDYD